MFKLLRLFGYFGGIQGELTTEQQVIKCLLDAYTFEAKMAEHFRNLHSDDMAWKEKAQLYKRIADTLASESKSVKRTEQHFGMLKDEPEDEPKETCKVFPFKIVDGDKPFEDKPPFAPQTPS